MDMRAEIEEKAAVAISALRELRRIAAQLRDPYRGDVLIDLVGADRAVKRARTDLLAALEKQPRQQAAQEG